MLRQLWKIISNILLAVLVALVVILVLPRVFGVQPLVVLSGSMEPTYHVGSLIYVTNFNPKELNIGDICIFLLFSSIPIAIKYL